MIDTGQFPTRRSVRLRGFDYAQAGLYFVTICTHGKACKLGRVVSEGVVLSRLGRIVRDCWMEIPRHFARVHLDAFVVMPNHVHAILVLHGALPAQRAQHAAPLQAMRSTSASAAKVAPGSVSVVIRSFKSAVSRRARKQLGASRTPIWQRGFYEHVMRNGRDLDETRRYIWQNPTQWAWDRENPASGCSSNNPVVGAQHAAPVQNIRGKQTTNRGTLGILA